MKELILGRHSSERILQIFDDEKLTPKRLLSKMLLPHLVVNTEKVVFSGLLVLCVAFFSVLQYFSCHSASSTIVLPHSEKSQFEDNEME